MKTFEGKAPTARGSWGPTLLVCAALAIFAARALDTARTYNHTYDEPTQIASGLELLQYGTFEHHMDAPPLAKVVMALPLYLAGVRHVDPPGRGDLEAANTLLYERTDYWWALRTARATSTIEALLLLFLI